ncbi:MAG: alanine racemase [Actinomycetota bacterium]|nr:alanine racemase [Actinomycetota bacterium]
MSPTGTTVASYRPAWAEIDVAAIRHNTALLASVSAPAVLCAVVKADGYGHGAESVARAALEGGATILAVALVEEGVRLRRAGIDAPMLVLSEPPLDAMDAVVSFRLTPALYTFAGVHALVRAADRDTQAPVPVHLKVDTGMHRVGCAPSDALTLAVEIGRHPSLQLEGVFTHLAVADEIDDPYTADQLSSYAAVLDELAMAGIRPAVRHAANSAGTLWHPAARLDLVRCGISIYGLAPCHDGQAHGSAALLRPALSLKARVSYVKTLPAGERLSYGLRYRLDAPSMIATVPIGYADGLTRGLAAAAGEVLIGGRRRPIAGTVTMDQILVDCGPGPVAVGDEVVLIGAQGDQVLTAWDWAARTGTIAYEVVCGLGSRIPRLVVDR